VKIDLSTLDLNSLTLLLKAMVNNINTPTAPTVKAEPKATKRDLTIASNPVFEPITVTIKGFTKNGETKTGLRRYSPDKVTFKGAVDNAKFYLSGNAIYAPKGARVNGEAIEVTFQSSPMLNKDGTVKHSKGGHSLKTTNTIVLDNGVKFFVDGYYAAK